MGGQHGGTTTVVDDVRSTAGALVLLDRYATGALGVVGTVAGVSALPDVRILARLAAEPGRRPHELMATTGLSRPSTAAVVARLEQLGLVERRFGTADRRTTLAALTPAAGPVLDRLAAQLDEWFAGSASLRDELVAHLAPTASSRRSGPRVRGIAAAGRLADAMSIVTDDLGSLAPGLGRRALLGVAAVAGRSPARPRELSDLLGLSSAGLTYVMDGLAHAGLVVRTSGAAPDRRSVLVELTAAGTATAESIARVLRTRSDDVVAAVEGWAGSVPEGGPKQVAPSVILDRIPPRHGPPGPYGGGR